MKRRRRRDHDEGPEADGALVARCLDGDADAWAELLTRHRPLILGIARRCGMVGADAEDVFQSVCVTMVERLDVLRRHESLAAWIATTTSRRCWRERRRQPAPAAELKDDAGDAPPPEEVFHEALQVEATHRAIDSLGEPCRSLLRLLYVDALPYKEVAKRLGLALGSVGVYRARCVERLRTKLAAAGWSVSSHDAGSERGRTPRD